MRRRLPLALVLLLAARTAAADPCSLVPTADFARVLDAPVIRRWSEAQTHDDEYEAPVAECIANSDDARFASLSIARYENADTATAALERLAALARSRATTAGATVTRRNDTTLIIATESPRMLAVTLRLEHRIVSSTVLLADRQSASTVTAMLEELARGAARAVARPHDGQAPIDRDAGATTKVRASLAPSSRRNACTAT
jgi:hypothetical protein